MSDLPLFDPFKALEEARREARQKLPQKLPQPPAEANRDTEQGLSTTSATSAASAGSGSAPLLAPARVNTITCKNSSSSSVAYARTQAPEPAHLVTGSNTPAEAAETAEVLPSHCNESEILEIGVAEVFGGDLRKWREALAGLSSDTAPCPGFRASEWPQVRSRALAFLDTFGPQAIALGWTAPRLFGVHPVAGIVRVDACGGLVLPIGGPIRAITATEIRFGHLTYREKPGQPEGTPIWSFGR